MFQILVADSVDFYLEISECYVTNKSINYTSPWASSVHRGLMVLQM